MQKYIIFSDVHLCGPLAMNVVWEYGPNCIYLGDNVDLTHCLKKNLPYAKEMFDFFKSKKFGVFCTGNHDHNEFIDRGKIINSILFFHGDSFFWGERKSILFRNKEYGQGSWLNWCWQQMIDKIFAWFPVYISRNDREFLINEMRNHFVSKVVVGHRHVKKLKIIKLGTYTLYIVPRGRTELYL